jgi:hypothetical protein
MKVPEGRPTIARRFNGRFRSSKPIESRRDERNHAFVRAISVAPSGLSRFVFIPTVKTVGYFLSSRRDLNCAARTAPEVLAHGHHSLESAIAATNTFRSGTIDRLVYYLYGPTEEEIKIVEEEPK